MDLFRDNYGDLTGVGRSFIGSLVLAVGLGFVGGCTAITNNWKCSEGDRVGMINKVSRKGYIWQTYECQMALEGIASNDNSVGANVWEFAIDNYWPKEKQDELAEQLRKTMNSRQKVKTHYTEMVRTFPWRSGSSHLVQSVQPLQDTGIERKAETPYIESIQQRKTDLGVEVNVDDKSYLLRHDSSGKLKITEMKEIQ